MGNSERSPEESFSPPRARDRDLKDDLGWQAGKFSIWFSSWFLKFLPLSFRVSSMRPVIILFASLAVPGSGQLLNGNTRSGLIGFFSFSALMLLVYILLFLPFVSFFFILLGVLLSLLHFNAYTESLKVDKDIDPPIKIPVLTFLVFFFTFFYVMGIMVVFSGTFQSMEVFGNNFAPTIMPGDTIVIQRGLQKSNIAVEDMVMVNNILLERVFATEGDLMELKENVLFINGKPENDPLKAPISNLNSKIRRGLPEGEIAKILPARPTQVLRIPRDNVGLVESGNLRSIPIPNLVGRVESIVWPFSRRKIFPPKGKT